MNINQSLRRLRQRVNGMQTQGNWRDKELKAFSLVVRRINSTQLIHTYLLIFIISLIFGVLICIVIK